MSCSLWVVIFLNVLILFSLCKRYKDDEQDGCESPSSFPVAVASSYLTFLWIQYCDGKIFF